jgi:hypothetical protein
MAVKDEIITTVYESALKENIKGHGHMIAT